MKEGPYVLLAKKRASLVLIETHLPNSTFQGSVSLYQTDYVHLDKIKVRKTFWTQFPNFGVWVKTFKIY